MQEPHTPSPGALDHPQTPLHNTDELVAAMKQGDPRVGRALYARYADRLYDLARSCTHDDDEAALIVSDLILESSQVCLGVRHLSLTTWMYSGLREHLMNSIGSKIAPDDRVIPLPANHDITNPDQRGQLIWTALAGASERDQVMANLVIRHHTSSVDLAKIMGISEASSNLLWETTAATLRTQLSALLALSWLRAHPLDQHPHTPGVLAPLLDLAATWDGNYTPLVHREAATQLIQHPDIQAWVMTTIEDPLASLARVPLQPAPEPLQTAVNDRLDMAWQLRAEVAALAEEPAGTPLPLPTPVEEDDSTIPPGAWPGGPITPEDQGTPPPEATTNTPAISNSQPGKAKPKGRKPPTFKLFPRPLLVGLVASAGIVVGIVGTLTFQQHSLSRITDSNGEPVVNPTANYANATQDDLVANPGQLTVPTGYLPIESGTTTSMLLANTGGTALNWTIEQLPDWVESNATGGTLSPGATVEVPLTLAKLSDSAEQTGTIDIHWQGINSGFSTVTVRAQAGKPPQVGELTITQTAPVCNQALDLSLPVEDSAGVKEVTVTGLTDAGTTYAQALTLADGATTWMGTLGPIIEPGNLRLSVTATDSQNNTIEANRGSIVIHPCTPQ